jgi:hypothetical protein
MASFGVTFKPSYARAGYDPNQLCPVAAGRTVVMVQHRVDNIYCQIPYLIAHVLGGSSKKVLNFGLSQTLFTPAAGMVVPRRTPLF